MITTSILWALIICLFIMNPAEPAERRAAPSTEASPGAGSRDSKGLGRPASSMNWLPSGRGYPWAESPNNHRIGSAIKMLGRNFNNHRHTR
jgi:hypothetical protein